jgi:hypothetical protein
MRESWIRPFAYKDYKRELTLVGTTLVVIILFLGVEIMLWDNSKKAVRTGQKVEILIGHGKNYARLRDDTKKVIEITARTQQDLLRLQRLSPAFSKLDPAQKKHYRAKNQEVIAKLESWKNTISERYSHVGLKWMARK